MHLLSLSGERTLRGDGTIAIQNPARRAGSKIEHDQTRGSRVGDISDGSIEPDVVNEAVAIRGTVQLIDAPDRVGRDVDAHDFGAVHDFRPANRRRAYIDQP